MKLFSEALPWYKGNLHTHTTLSDGRATPEETFALYKAEGYSFMALTDHRKRYPGFEDKDFVVIPAGEYHLNDMATNTAYHIVGLNIASEVINTDADRPQEIIDKVVAAGGMAVVAHPAWSLMRHDELISLEHYEATEIFNGVSDAYSNRGCSADHIDSAAAKGKLPLLFATDDTHFYDTDKFLGFIWLQTGDFSIDGIMKAIRAKQFYASQGPRFGQITVEDGQVQVEMETPVKRISVMSNAFFAGGRVIEQPGQLITFGSYKIGGYDKWIRVEAADAEGKRCWSNFIALK